jgi:hypothetical protein
MNKSTFQFELSDLRLEVSQIESILGYQEGEEHEIVSELIDKLLKETGKICNIRAEYIIYDGLKFNVRNKSIEINNINFDIRKIVFRQLSKSESVALFLCTAGEEIGIRSRKAMKECDLLNGFIYDIIGSQIVEAAADMMQGFLENSVSSSGKKITNRYSPGYCSWDVAEQHKLFKLIPDNFCGIKLTHSALMDPVKSTSGIIGIGENVEYNPYTCSYCGQKDCSYRKVRDSREVDNREMGRKGAGNN